MTYQNIDSWATTQRLQLYKNLPHSPADILISIGGEYTAATKWEPKLNWPFAGRRSAIPSKYTKDADNDDKCRNQRSRIYFETRAMPVKYRIYSDGAQLSLYYSHSLTCYCKPSHFVNSRKHSNDTVSISRHITSNILRHSHVFFNHTVPRNTRMLFTTNTNTTKTLYWSLFLVELHYTANPFVSSHPHNNSLNAHHHHHHRGSGA